MNAVPNYLDKFGRNFLVASMIPSLAFFTITMISLEPILPTSLKGLLGGEFELLGESGFLLLILTIILAFTLTSLNTFIYKVFEGYVLIQRLHFLRKSQLKRARQLRQRQKSLEKKINRLKNSTSKRAIAKRNHLKVKEMALRAEYDLDFPPSEDEILPTKFGNILRSAESYPMTRYSIDGIHIWPRLIHVMPGEYFSKVNQVNNQLSFLMNCTVLALIYSLIILGVSIYHFVISIASMTKYFEIAGAYLLVFLSAVIVGVVFLRTTGLVIYDLSNVIRSSFDLFRRKLLVELDLYPPLNLRDERSLWEDLCDFLKIGFQEGITRFDFQPVSGIKSGPPSHQSKPENDDN